MTSPAERKALNEGAFRDANERLEGAAHELLRGDDGSFVPFLCECPKRDCMQVVLLTLAEYEQVRSRGEQGLAALGHEDRTVEHVVDENERFVTTLKFGEAGEVHAEGDPRG